MKFGTNDCINFHCDDVQRKPQKPEALQTPKMKFSKSDLTGEFQLLFCHYYKFCSQITVSKFLLLTDALNVVGFDLR